MDAGNLGAGERGVAAGQAVSRQLSRGLVGHGTEQAVGWRAPRTGVGRKEALLLTPPVGPQAALTHQQCPGSRSNPSGHPLGASAAPHSPQLHPRWAPRRWTAAAGPAEGPSPGHPRQPAGRVGRRQDSGSPGLPAPSHACPGALTHPPTGCAPPLPHPWGWGTWQLGSQLSLRHHSTHLG